VNNYSIYDKILPEKPQKAISYQFSLTSAIWSNSALLSVDFGGHKGGDQLLLSFLDLKAPPKKMSGLR